MALVMEETFLTSDEVAKKMRVSRNLVLLMIRRGELPATQFGKKQYRVKVSDLAEYIRQHSTRQEDESSSDE